MLEDVERAVCRLKLIVFLVFRCVFVCVCGRSTQTARAGGDAGKTRTSLDSGRNHDDGRVNIDWKPQGN